MLGVNISLILDEPKVCQQHVIGVRTNVRFSFRLVSIPYGRAYPMVLWALFLIGSILAVYILACLVYCYRIRFSRLDH